MVYSQLFPKTTAYIIVTYSTERYRHLYSLISLPAERSQHGQFFLSFLVTFKNRKHTIINLYFNIYSVLYAKIVHRIELNSLFTFLFFRRFFIGIEIPSKEWDFTIISSIFFISFLKLHFVWDILPKITEETSHFRFLWSQ